MRSATPDEYFGLAVAAIVLVIILIVAFMCIQLYHFRKPVAAARRDGFMGTFYYTPSCGSEWVCRRGDCRGVTAGAMPAIEADDDVGIGLCCGRLGVPP
jgi:hypothetical protein